MRIGLLAPSIYMSPTHFGDMIFAPRDLAVHLADGLAERGHEVYFFTAPDIQSKATVIAGDGRLLTEEYRIAKLAADGPSQRATWASFYTRKRNYEADLTSKCFAKAQAGELDVIHSFQDDLAHFFEDTTHVPVVYTLHDPLPATPKDLSHWLFSKFKNHRYVSISNSFRKNDTVGLRFIETIYHGILPSQFPFNSTPKDSFLFMGRMVPEKGLDDAMEAAIQADVPLLVGAPIPEKGKESAYFLSRVQPHLADSHIHEVGVVNTRARMELYANARALLFPIRWEEPFGIVMIEAMACGTPVIAYNRGSVSEVVRDGVTGFVINPQEGVAGLVNAIQRIGEIDRMACRKHVEDNFSVEKMVQEHEKMYQKIFDSKSA